MRRTEAARAVMDSPWTPMTKLVGLALLALADRNGLVPMTQSQLGLRCGVSDRTVRSALAEMAAGGRLVVGHERSCFRVLLDDEGEGTGPPEPEPASGSGVRETGTSFRKQTPRNRNVVPEVPEAGSGSSPELRASRTVSENSSLSEISSESKTVDLLDFCSVEPRAGVNASENSEAPEAKVLRRQASRKISSARSWRRAPSDWHPNLEHSQIATSLGVDLELELAKFRDHEFRVARVDADATFRNWLRNARPAPRAGNGNGNGNGSHAPPRAFNRAQDTLDRQLERVKELRAEEAREAAERAAVK